MQTTSLESNLFVPCFAGRVTENLLDEMISTGKYVDHGGDLEDQWNGGVFDYQLESTFPHIIGRGFAEIRHTDEFRNTLRSLLVILANEHRSSLVNGCAYDKLPPLNADMPLYRSLTTNELRNETVGVYWTQKKSQSLDRFIDQNEGGLLLTTTVGEVTIDWDATIRSRLDLSNGQDEAEIQIVTGSAVTFRAQRVTYSGGLPTLEDVTNHVGKA